MRTRDSPDSRSRQRCLNPSRSIRTFELAPATLYPVGINPATGAAWAPITDGLRNITGRVSRDGTVTIWGITSKVSGNGDQGADPNKLVAITDVLANTKPAVAVLESFVTVRAAEFGEVLRGVSFAPSRTTNAASGKNNGREHLRERRRGGEEMRMRV